MLNVASLLWYWYVLNSIMFLELKKNRNSKLKKWLKLRRKDMKYISLDGKKH